MAIRLVNTSRSLLPFLLTYLFEKLFENEQLFYFYFKNHLMNHGYKIGMYMNCPPFFCLISIFAISTKMFQIFPFSCKQKKQHDLHVAFCYILPLMVSITSVTF